MRQQLVGTERLGQVIVRAGVQPRNPVVFSSACGQHDHRDLALPPQQPQQLEAVQSRHHDIEQEQVVTAPQSPRQAAPAVVDNFEVHAPASEEALHQLAELNVVIDEQDRDPRVGLASF